MRRHLDDDDVDDGGGGDAAAADGDDDVGDGDHLITNEIDTKIKISYGQTSIDLILTPRVMSIICIVIMIIIVVIVNINNLTMIVNMMMMKSIVFMMTCIIHHIMHIPTCLTEIISS